MVADDVNNVGLNLGFKQFMIAAVIYVATHPL